MNSEEALDQILSHVEGCPDKTCSVCRRNSEAQAVLEADARALWAVRVLDRAYVRMQLDEPLAPQVNETGEWTLLVHAELVVRAGSAAAARIAAAGALVAEDPSLGEGL